MANCNEHVAEANITAPAQSQRALQGAQGSRGKSGKITSFSCSGYSRACHRLFLFPCQTTTRSFLRCSAPLRLFSAACSPPLVCFFARDCAHARHRRRRRALRRQRRAARPHQRVLPRGLWRQQVRTRTVFFEPGMIGAVRASPLGELFRLSNLVNQKRGQQLGQGPLQKVSASIVLTSTSKWLRTNCSHPPSGPVVYRLLK